MLRAFAALNVPNALLILVPRHPQRFDEVSALIATVGMTSARRSVWAPKPVAAGSGADVPPPLPSSVQVLLGDSMGELGAYYAAADLAFIGGSLLPLGGQNLIEACAAGVPVLIGPHTFNFTQATNDAIAAGAALRVDSPQALAQGLRELFNDKARRIAMSAAAAAFAARHRGATERTVEILSVMLEEESGRLGQADSMRFVE